jgi:hypothetical protein
VNVLCRSKGIIKIFGGINDPEVLDMHTVYVSVCLGDKKIGQLTAYQG